ncbi:DeoR family transcriptional regulator [Alkalibaculum sp. M08DMB]|uniref:DeoR family transcriptional regulator n=1 Tax=Alkalibaculum sporogenes TaxID=2655001 RepID=A0A6A7K8G0_9FIRM|nr:DeoR/GlpR family DNA-binding transcription regulator [Alkalibaculum sporogenes]MPW25672.1 DeoR family transcriptional regulator [Alkalibaculum sporogenes]
MFAQERLDSITQLLYKDGKVIVKDLSKKYQVSEDAIRKDLKILENQGIMERTYGGGILKKRIAEFTNVGDRNKKDKTVKNIIANKAFKLIKRGETILLDISSTNMILAEMIRDSEMEITVISNSIDILYILSKSSKITLISPGGMYFCQAGGFVGSETINSIRKYNVQKAFIGSCGVDLDLKSITTFNVEDGNTKNAFIHCGKEVFLVMENKKFNYDGIYKFANINQITGIITEGEPSNMILKKLNKNKINLL